MNIRASYFCYVLLFISRGILAEHAALNASEGDRSNVGVTEEIHSLNTGSNLEPSLDDTTNFIEGPKGNTFNPSIFEEATTQNSALSNEINSNGPVAVTLTDLAAAELRHRAAIPPSQTDNLQVTSHNETEKTSTPNRNETEEDRSEPYNLQTDNNIMLESPSAKPKENLTEDIPSFSEWTQKRLEAEKNEEALNISIPVQNLNGKQGSGAKFRWKNYASLDCGAKVVASNPEAVSPSSVLSPSRDEYKLTPCTSRIWFIVELCEAIQAKKIDFANFELFSSSPKDFSVSISDRFPTRDWSNVGHFTAKDERDIQSFDLLPQLFGKYIKVEVKSHYGQEHYCPISLFRVYGTSEFEVLQKEEHANVFEDDDDNEDNDVDMDNGDSGKNLFSSATDAVISMVKKAAEVLGNKGNQSNQSDTSSNTTIAINPQLISMCVSPSHLIVCDNCSDTFFGKVFEIFSCRYYEIERLVNVFIIRKSLIETNICRKYGFDLNWKSLETHEHTAFIIYFFPQEFLCAMCNFIGVVEHKVTLNVSSNYVNATVKDENRIVNIETSIPHIKKIENTNEDSKTPPPIIMDLTEDNTKTSCSTDISYISQIKPTKAMASDIDPKESDELFDTIIPTLKTAMPTETANLHVDSSAEKLNIIAPVEVILDNVESVLETESSEGLDEHVDSIISELNENSQNVPNVPASSSTPQIQKESVFLRLSNRIKVLERNMSLSSQYLEELSKRYKKQVEEMQKLLEKTILALNEENKKKDDHNKELEEKLIELSNSVENLLTEKKSWSSTISCVIITFIVTVCVFTFCWRSSDTKQVDSIDNKTESPQRRKSIDVISHIMPPKKKRRPSDQALKIVRSSMLAIETETMQLKEKEKRKKRKRHSIRRSHSINGKMDKVDLKTEKWTRPDLTQEDWVENVNGRDGIPFFLEESDQSTLESLELPSTPKCESNVLSFSTDSKEHNENYQNNGVLKQNATETVGSTTFYGNGNTSITSKAGEQQILKKEKKGLKRILKKVF